jgi:hypothetical protein
LGEFEPALAAYDRAASLPGPAQMDAIANRGGALHGVRPQGRSRGGDRGSGEGLPPAPGILFSQTELKRFEPGDPLVGQMQALLSREGISLSDRATLHFGLGKVFLDMGASEKAFGHYDEGNRLKRSTYAYDADANGRRTASIAEVFSPTLLSAKANMGARSNLPVFVVGMPRSGTTLVEQILASHPMVHGAGELKRLHSLVDEIEGFPNAAGDLTAAQFRRSARPISLSSSQWRRDDAMWWTRCPQTSCLRA